MYRGKGTHREIILRKGLQIELLKCSKMDMIERTKSFTWEEILRKEIETHCSCLKINILNEVET
jgi:hypothetical protein